MALKTTKLDYTKLEVCTFVDNYLPSASNDNSTDLNIGYSTLADSYAFLRFNISTIPVNAKIEIVKLYLYVEEAQNTTTYVRNVLSDSFTGVITWNTKPSYTSPSVSKPVWTQLGAPVTGSQWFNFEIKNIWDANKIQSGDPNKLSLCLTATGGTLRATSDNDPNTTLRPYLEVTYDDNSAPTIALNATNSRTLYENDTFVIDGTVNETNVGDTATVRYQLNAEPARAIKAFISTGATEAFSKSLTFKAGKLFDGETAVTGVLADGVAHKLKVYATDDQGGTSPVVERTFYAVPNRAPALTVDAVTPSGIINTDAFDISGSYSDQDGNTTTVRYKINGGNPVEIAQGTSGAWSFNLPLGKLVVGENTIVIEAEDTYGAKTSKTVKLRKKEVKTSIKTGVARYKIEPPTGTAQEVMLWIQHDANLTLDTAISMTQAAEAEAYVPMALTNTATLSNGQVESEFYYNASAAKENILVQITQTKTTADADEKITLISGVL